MSKKNETYNEKDKEKDVRSSNIQAAKGVAELIRTSLGPKGMDKMITDANGETSISNDGATILKQLQVTHPTAKMLVELSKAQDIEAGDGTTSVVVIAGALVNACQGLIDQGIHPTKISESFQHARDKSVQILEEMATKIDITDRDQLIKAAVTSLSSKIVSQNANLLAPIAADSILKIINPTTDTNVDLNDVKIVKKLGGTVDDSEIVDGLVFNNKVSHTAGGPTRIENAKIGLIQFQLSPPKTDMENNVVVTDYTMMDRILREERAYLLNLCKKIKASGCNVLLVQKSILRDAVTDVSLHFLAKMKIMVIKDVERTDVEFISKTLNLLPIASIDSFTPEKLGTAALVHEEDASGEKVVKVTGIQNKGKTITVLLRGSNRLMLDETERSLHDALCVMRSLVKKRFLIAGGGAPEIELSLRLGEHAKTLVGAESYCFKAFAEALEVIPTTLAENAGLHPIGIVTDLRNRHAQGEKYAGINVRKGLITNILEENVIQPLLVSISAITLATETIRMILKIDDIVITR